MSPPPRPLRVILFRAAYNLPVTLGIECGVFARHGLALDVVYTRGSQMTTEALASGECDLGVMAADDVVYEVETRGRDFFVFMGLHAGILQLVARPEIRDAHDLVGARLGVDDPNSGFALVAHRILAQMGVKRSDYETLAMGGHEPRARALSEGRIDLALSTPPFSLDLMARGFRLLAKARDYVPDYLGSCGVASRAWAAANRSTLAAYVVAYRESLEWALAPEHRPRCIEHLRTQFDLEPALATQTFDAIVDTHDGLYRDARIDVPGLRTVLDLRVNAGLLPVPVPEPAKFYDARLVE